MFSIKSNSTRYEKLSIWLLPAVFIYFLWFMPWVGLVSFFHKIHPIFILLFYFLLPLVPMTFLCKMIYLRMVKESTWMKKFSGVAIIGLYLIAIIFLPQTADIFRTGLGESKKVEIHSEKCALISTRFNRLIQMKDGFSNRDWWAKNAIKEEYLVSEFNYWKLRGPTISSGVRSCKTGVEVEFVPFQNIAVEVNSVRVSK